MLISVKCIETPFTVLCIVQHSTFIVHLSHYLYILQRGIMTYSRIRVRQLYSTQTGTFTGDVFCDIVNIAKTDGLIVE